MLLREILADLTSAEAEASLKTEAYIFGFYDGILTSPPYPSNESTSLFLTCIFLLYTFDWLLCLCPSSISNRTNMMASKCCLTVSFVSAFPSHSRSAWFAGCELSFLELDFFELFTVSTVKTCPCLIVWIYIYLHAVAWSSLSSHLDSKWVFVL